MKSVVWLANSQIVLGIVLIIVVLRSFPADSYRNHEVAIGENLIEYSQAVESHKKLAENIAEHVYKKVEVLEKIAEKCKKLADGKIIRKIPAHEKIEELGADLSDLANAFREHEKEFPETIQALENTSQNLQAIGNRLKEYSPVGEVLTYVKKIGFLVAIMMIMNGFAFRKLAIQKQ